MNANTVVFKELHFFRCTHRQAEEVTGIVPTIPLCIKSEINLFIYFLAMN